MDLKNLTKDQKQSIGVIGVGLIILIVLVGIGFKVGFSSIPAAQLELDEMNKKVSQAENLLRGSEKSQLDLAKIGHELGSILGSLPPERNYYSWATEIIYDVARLVHLDVDAIDEQSNAVFHSKKSDKNAIHLESYSLRVTAHGGYEGIKSFLKEIEKNQPLARISGVNIRATQNPEMHDVILFVHWPIGLDSIAESQERVLSAQKKN